MSELRCPGSILIVGGGSAGWMTAAYLSRFLKGTGVSITVLESPLIETVGVGEATIPPIRDFNLALGINEDAFIMQTKATFKLGIEFSDWGKLGERYFHPFGSIGRPTPVIPFHQYWMKFKQLNPSASPAEFSLETQMAARCHFSKPDNNRNSPLFGLGYAYHFDAALYAGFLSNYAMNYGVHKIKNTVGEVLVNSNTGMIDGLLLDNGQKLTADLYVDCTGFRSLLLGDALNVGFESWEGELLCDRAIAIPSSSVQPHPYTRSTAWTAGWHWQIPLQHRTGNGLVYSSKYVSDEEALDYLLKKLEGYPLAEPKRISFHPGRREDFWVKNCVAIGLSAGFLEPLESTSIHLIQSGITRLFDALSSGSVSEATVRRFNKQVGESYMEAKDFVVLHYKLTQREDSEFWKRCGGIEISLRLLDKISMYQSSGQVFRDNGELFDVTNWLAVFDGQGAVPGGYHPGVDRLTDAELNRFMADTAEVIKKAVANMPKHSEHLAAIQQS